MPYNKLLIDLACSVLGLQFWLILFQRAPQHMVTEVTYYALTKILRMTKTTFPTDSYILRLIQYFYDQYAVSK